MPVTTGIAVDAVGYLGVDRTSSYVLSSAEERQVAAVTWFGAGPSNIRSGVLPGSVDTLVTATAAAWSVAASRLVVSDGAGGAWQINLPTTKTDAMPTAPGSGTTRYDALVLEPFDTGSIAGRYFKLRLYYGTASGSPSLAATLALVPAGSYVLATMLTANTGAPTVTQAWQYTTTAGGVLELRTSAERDTLDAAGLYPGIKIFRRDLGLEQINVTGVAETTTAGSWASLPPSVAPHFRGTAGTVTANTNAPFTSQEDTESGWGGLSYTVRRAGVYRIGCQYQAPSGGIGSGENIYVMQNGAQARNLYANASATPTVATFGSSTTLRAAVGDVIAIQCPVGFTPFATISSFLNIDWLRP